MATKPARRCDLYQRIESFGVIRVSMYPGLSQVKILIFTLVSKLLLISLSEAPSRFIAR